MSRAIATAMQIGPDPATGLTRIEVALDDGNVVAIVLDPGHANRFARRVDAITSGAIAEMPPSLRALVIEFPHPDALVDTERPKALGGGRR